MTRGTLVALLAGLAAALLAGLLMFRQAPVPAGAGSTIGSRESSSIVRLENDQVMVVENRYGPGSESAMHTHPHPRVVHVLAGGSLVLVGEDGSETPVETETGMTLWRPAETHVVRNVGGTTVRLLEVEIRSME